MILTCESARPEDLDTLFQLNRQLIDTYEDVTAIDYNRVLTWVRKNLEKNLPHFTRIFSDGSLAGYYCLMSSGEKIELDSLFVLPEFQNRGIGTHILKKCQKETPSILFLYVFQKNTRALALYKRLGFQIVKETGTSRYIMEYQKQGC